MKYRSRERLIERLIASAPLYELYIQHTITEKRGGPLCSRGLMAEGTKGLIVSDNCAYIIHFVILCNKC